MDPNTTIKVPDAVREMGDKAVEQTEKAFGTFLRAANQSVAAIPARQPTYRRRLSRLRNKI
jgi:hypothetical protein